MKSITNNHPTDLSLNEIFHCLELIVRAMMLYTPHKFFGIHLRRNFSRIRRQLLARWDDHGIFPYYELHYYFKQLDRMYNSLEPEFELFWNDSIDEDHLKEVPTEFYSRPTINIMKVFVDCIEKCQDDGLELPVGSRNWLESDLTPERRYFFKEFQDLFFEFLSQYEDC